MQKYTKEFAEKVRQATDIVKIVNEYTPLTKDKDTYIGKSPFTRARLETLTIFPDKQFFKDFATRESGNVITFVAHAEKISFDAALEKLARKAHITITEADYYKDPQATLKKNLYAVMEAAATFYHNQMKAAGGEIARDYVAQRGLKEDTVKQFKLGFSPGTGQALYNYLQHQGFTNDVMIRSGLIKVADGKPYDYFRNRLMFPIWNKEGQVVAFTGRILKTEIAKDAPETKEQNKSAQTEQKGPPKYVNSATSPIFNKSEALYGINFAKNTKKPFYVLVEGQMDAIMLHQAGYDNVVAISGTAFTEIHCQALQTKTFRGREVAQEGLMIATDGDSAGREAKLKIIKKGSEFLPFGMRVVEWPAEYKDPAELINACGEDIFQKCLVSSSIPADVYVIQVLVEKHTNPETQEVDMNKVTQEFVDNFTLKEQRGMQDKEIDQRMSAVVAAMAEPTLER